MARVLYTPEAEKHLDEIFDHISREQHRPAAAANVLRQIDKKCRLFARFPLAAESREDLAPGVRGFSVESLVVLYRPTEDGILVLAVFHGHQDIPAAFRVLLADR